MPLLSQEKTDRLVESGKRAEQVLDQILAGAYENRDEMAALFQRYYAERLDIEEEDISDEIDIMIRLSVARSMHVDPENLHKVDLPATCNHTTAVMNKRFLLFIAIQKKLGVRMQPEKVPYIVTFDDLAGEFYGKI